MTFTTYFSEVDSPYPLLLSAFDEDDDLILTSLLTQLCLIIFSATPDEVIPEDLFSAGGKSETEQ